MPLSGTMYPLLYTQSPMYAIVDIFGSGLAMGGETNSNATLNGLCRVSGISNFLVTTNNTEFVWKKF